MSNLHIRVPFPSLLIRSVASSKCEYSHENWSLEMKSLMDAPWGCDRSMINLTEPSFLGAEPIGEQCVMGKGGSGKGPAV